MKRQLSTLIATIGLAGSALSAHCLSDSRIAPFLAGSATGNLGRIDLALTPIFEQERGVTWDGRIDWKTQERAWVFAAALEGSLKGIVRAGSPYRLRVAVVRAEKQTGTFVVEFTIQDPSGVSLEVVEVEGICPRNRSGDEVYPLVAGEIVTTFKKTILQ